MSTTASPLEAEPLDTTRVATSRVNVLGPVLEVGNDDMRRGAIFGLGLAGLAHGYVVARVALALFSMGEWLSDARAELHDFFWTTYEVETETKKAEPEKEEPPPPPEPPPPEPELPEPKAPEPQPDDPYKEEPPPAAPLPAAAPDLQTAKDDGQDPEEFYNVVDNDGGKGAMYGQVATNGQGDKPVTDPRARPDGKPGGTGTAAAAAPPPPTVDKSKPPALVGSTSWNCPFPPEADAEGKDNAVATIVVTVRPDGTPQSVSVLADPGAGFGRAARMCALGKRFQPGLDKDGNATTAQTPPIRVRFAR
jgi:protein TonB